MVDATVMREVLQQAPFGYAYHQIILDENGEPIDYVFLDANPAFAAMTGLNASAIIGQRVTQILPDIRVGEFDWVAVYSEVALTGAKREFTQYAQPLGRWYKVTAVSPRQGYFATLFQDITDEIEQINLLEKQKQQIVALTNDLEMVFNGTQDAMFLVAVQDGEYRYVRTNRTHHRLTGLAPSDITDKTPAELFGAEIGAMLAAKYDQCVAQRAPLTYEDQLPFPIPDKVWLTTLTPVFEDGEVKYLIGAKRDITNQKQAEKERADLLARLQAMFTGHDAVMLLIEPESGHIVDANPAASLFYGYSRDELLAMHIQDINLLPSDEVAYHRQLAAQNRQHCFHFPHRLANGEIRLVDVYSCPIDVNGRRLLFSIIFDVTDRERYKEELVREKELLRTTLLSIGDGVVTTNKDGLITALNRAAEAITGWRQKEVYGKPFATVFKLINETTEREIDDPVSKVLRTGRTVGLANHTALITKDGRQVPIADTAAPIRDEKGRTFGVVMVFRDVTREKAHQEQIRYLSYHDPLTGLYNRRFMEEQMRQHNLERNLPLAVILGDVNGLKLANDVFGHHEGDKLLKKAAKAIKASCRKKDIIARWGGDEFLILLPNTTEQVAEDIIARIIKNCDRYNHGTVQLSIALGSAVKHKGSTSLAAVVKEAEERMYRRKLMNGKSYRNAIVNTMRTTLSAKSAETSEHAERLQDLCLQIGRALNLSGKELDDLMLLAMLHDIGKVGIKETILMKPGPLTPAEWEEMKKHPEIGYRIAQNTPELAAIADYILHHHEHWDGKGYPRGLVGEEIPLACRILAVADAYDAMTSDRPYRKGMAREAALAEIRRCAGTQFDPKIVDVFLLVSGDGEQP